MRDIRVLPIVPSGVALPNEFEGVDYHDGWTFEGDVEAQAFAETAAQWPGVVYVEIVTTSDGERTTATIDGANRRPIEIIDVEDIEQRYPEWMEKDPTTGEVPG